MAGYLLGVDLGTTWTAAAVSAGGPAAVVTLGTRSAAIPTVIHLDAEGAVSVGDAALRRGASSPERLAREMKRRIGDPTPVLLGGEPWSPELLQARVLRWVVDTVAAEQGGPPEALTVTHPANWGPYKLDLLAQAIRQVGLDDATLLPEPVAAAAWYASQHRVPEGSVLAVYDLGGGTFDTAVVRRTGDGFEILGRPDGVERLGGIDFDAAVLGHVVGQIVAEWDQLDPSDPEAQADVAALRDECVEAKEALSTDTSVTIPVRLPAFRTSIRLTRDELEAMVRGPLGETLVAVQRTIGSAELTPADLDAVLLVGGSSRMPLVGQLVANALGVQVAVDANPKYAVALGAAMSRHGATAVAPAPPSPPTGPPDRPGEPEPPRHEPPEAGPAPTPARTRRRRLQVVGGVVAVILLATAVAFLARGDGGDGTGGDDGGLEQFGAGGDEVPEGDGTLRVGVLVPETGDADFLAPAMQAAAELAVADLNEAGGVLGAPVELVVADSGADDGDLDDAFDVLLDAGVDYVVGPVDAASGRSRAVDEGLGACAAHDGSIDALADDDGRYVRTVPDQALLATALVDALIEDGHTVVAMARPADAEGYAEALATQLADEGLELEKDVTFEPGALDAEAVQSELNDSGATGWLLVGSAELAEVVVAGASSGLTGPFFVDDAFEDDAVGRRIADAVEGGSVVLTVGADATPGFEQDGSVATRVGQALPEDDPFPIAAPYVYDCVVLGAVAAELAQSDHPDAIAGTVVEVSREGEPCFAVECLALAAEGTEVDMEGASGPLDLDDDGEVTSGPFLQHRWQADATLAFESATVVER